MTCEFYSHPSDKNKDVAWMGHPFFWGSQCSSSEPRCPARPRLCRFLFPIVHRTVRFERPEQPPRCRRNLFDSRCKSCLIRLRRFLKSADLAHELQRRRANLRFSDGWIEVEQQFDIPAHARVSTLRRAKLRCKFPKQGPSLRPE